MRTHDENESLLVLVKGSKGTVNGVYIEGASISIANVRSWMLYEGGTSSMATMDMSGYVIRFIPTYSLPARSQVSSDRRLPHIESFIFISTSMSAQHLWGNIMEYTLRQA